MTTVQDTAVDDAVRKMFAAECDAEVLAAAAHGDRCDSLWQTLEDAGLNLVGTPEHHGGSGGTFTDLLKLAQAIGYFGVPGPLVETAMANWLTSVVGLEPPSGRLAVAVAASGSLVTAAREGGDWVLRGDVERVAWARTAEAIVLEAATDAGRLVCLLDRADLDVRPDVNMAGEPRDQLVLAGQRLPRERAVLVEGVRPTDLLVLGAALRAAMMSGAIDRVVDLSIDYANDRVQFGSPIARFQAIQHHLAILAEDDLAAAVAVSACGPATLGDLDPSLAASAKVMAELAGDRVTARAHQLHGAIGVTAEYSLHHFTRRLWSWREEFGSARHWSGWLGARICAAGESGSWDFVSGRAPTAQLGP